MDLKYPFLFFLITLCPASLISLFAQNYTLSNWTVEDGLSSNETRGLLQDQEGFIWVATAHGLNKFNGYTFKNHRYNPSDSTSMGANYITSIWQDGEGNIWINLGVGILSKYSKFTKKFTNYFFHDHNTNIFDIKYIAGWGMCIATNKGLFTIDQPANRLRRIPLNKEINQQRFFKIFTASNQRIYLSTHKGLKLFGGAANSLNNTFIIGPSDTLDFSYSIEKLFKDSKGNIWVQTHAGGLYQSNDGIYFKESLLASGVPRSKIRGQLFISELARDSKVLFSNSHKLLIQSNDDQSWSIFPSQGEPIHFAFKDNAGHIWVCTKNNMLFKWNGKLWDFIIFFGDDLKFWEINEVFVDDKNGIWFGTHGKGVWRVYNRKWPISSLKNSDTGLPINFDVMALLIENEEHMLVGAYRHLFRYYFEIERLVTIFSGSNMEYPFSNLTINNIGRNTSGNIFAATNQGIIVMGENGENISHYNFIKVDNKKHALNYTRCILPDPYGNLWIGTTQGLYLLDLDTEQFYFYHPSQKGGKFLRGKDIQCIEQVNDTSLLIGYTKYGADLLVFNPDDYSIASQKIVYKNSQMEQSEYATINTFYQSSSEYWAGSFSKGLLRVNLDSLTMQPISEDFPIIPNVKGIQKGTKGNLWVSSIDGLRSVNPNDLTYYRFSKASGLLSNNFHLNSAVQGHNGNLYFGSKNGLNKIEPSKWNNQDTISTPILTEFKIYDESITFPQYLDEVETIYLNPNDDYITFEFVSPTYDNPGDVQYAYQLEGFNDNWQYCENHRSATYTNLDPGEYTFKIRAGNKGGFLNSETKKIQVIIAPPYWQTSWFILFVIGVLIFTGWVVYKIRRQIRMNRLKTIAEIRQKAADDFHDELGHRLTKIGLFVESLMMQKNTFPEKSAHILQKIQDNANELYHSTKDFIWAINPSKDSAIELFILLRDFGDELFDETDIQFSVKGLKEEYQDYFLDMDLKRQLVLIFKEAMNNALKHANCTKVIFKIAECKKHIKLSLVDNGNGFILNHKKFGYGLSSMFNRSKKVGGQLEVKTKIGEGTEILFKI